MRTRLIVVAMALLLTFAVQTTAWGHFLGYSSVDDGEIRWGSSTTFVAARDHAIGKWNDVGGIDILRDRWWTYEDVTFKDRRRADVAWAGLYVNQGGTDDILFNRHFMDGYGAAKRKNVATHELGHALGLAHSFQGQVMHRFVSRVTLPQAHDIADYEALWGD